MNLCRNVAGAKENLADLQVSQFPECGMNLCRAYNKKIASDAVECLNSLNAG